MRRGAALEEIIEESSGEIAFLEFRIVEDFPEECRVGADAAYGVFGEGPLETLGGSLSCWSPSRQLGEDTDAVLSETLGLNPDQIKQLRKDGAL